MRKEGSTLQTVKKEKAQGGEGYVLMKYLLDERELNGKCGLYSQVTIPAGCSLGYHKHYGESETYYILSGEGMYQDNEKEYLVKAGDVTFTPSGSGHGMKNNTEKDLVFMALIIKD